MGLWDFIKFVVPGLKSEKQKSDEPDYPTQSEFEGYIEEADEETGNEKEVRIEPDEDEEGEDEDAEDDIPSPEENEEGELVCPYCGKTYKTAGWYKKHVRGCTGE